jgi:hypothetical protein
MASARNSRSGRSAKFFKRQEEQKGADAPIPLRQRPSQGDSQRPIPLRPSQKVAPSDVVQTLPRPQTNPSWLKLLLVLQRTSSAFTFLLVVGLLVVYGWTVYTQQRWGRAYNRMEALQKQERQMMAANEVIKNQMAKQAEIPDSGLVLPEPGNTIFLTPAPQRPPVTPEVNMPPPQPIPARPLGY